MSKIYVPLLHWGCTRCGKCGDVEAEATADCLELERRILAAHEAVSRFCAEEWGMGGIATERVHPMPE